MRILVQKYGGSSLATPEAVLHVAQRVVATRRRGLGVVVVVSAMGDTTDELLRRARRMASDPCRRELDVLLATGEQISMSLLAMAIQDLGEQAVSLTGGQCGIITNDVHCNARILEIRPQRVREELERGAIVVAAGFQGVTVNGDVTTLGRGGSDTTAVALAAALGAECCEIYTDVDGVYSADPRIVRPARRIPSLGSDEMQELAWHGAQVLKAEAVEFAVSNNVDLEVRSTFRDQGGTRIRVRKKGDGDAYVPRRPEVAGVSGRKDLLRITLAAGMLQEPIRQEVFDALAKYDLIFGGIRSSHDTAELFISSLEMPDPEVLRVGFAQRFGGALQVSEVLGAVSLVGFGLGSRPAALLDAFKVLERTKVEVIQTFTGRESLTFVVPVTAVDDGVRELHHVFVENGRQDESVSVVPERTELAQRMEQP